ncbi:lasso peptide biosynthesis B2 protein [Paenibacillus sp. GSMTC-2017]|uniref:lasso peptide biosynthesis B2 protein n=1 Tax=Paenibacillus sp. GSMTC-2017 TaxID=2794350 RepID=UPI0018D97605|nr:lasso peptide biosynthesis B2 protein [Paenibacillus sp. GSMTC-2017]MBH5317286.1 lasso peptide biosynthesis B2 protein [Paenibacillus sp. GSMTC-2017]
MNKLRVLLKLDRQTFLLFVEALIFLAVARLLLYRPFMKVAPTLGTRTEITPEDCENKQVRIQSKKIASAVDVMSRNTFWESKCFVRAIACMKMLERRGIASTLYLGTGKDEHGKLIAHAWLRSGSIYMSGAEVMKEFIVVETFANKANFTAL